MKSALSLIAVAACVYICFCAYLYLFQRSFIYFPTPAVDGAPAEELWLDIDNERIRLWRMHAIGQDAILYFGGNAEDVSLNIPEFAEWFPDQAIYLVNYRGYGGSSGSPSETGLLRDAAAIFDFIEDSHRGVSVIGRSLGAAVAVHVAATRDVERLALVAPFDSLGRMAREYYPIFPTSILLKDTYDSLARADRIRAPVLVIVAGRDEIIPRKNSEKLVQAIAPSLVTLAVVDDAAHNTIDAFPEYGHALRTFISGSDREVARE